MKLTIIGDEKILKTIIKENKLRFLKNDMKFCIESETEKERPYENLETKEIVSDEEYIAQLQAKKNKHKK